MTKTQDPDPALLLAREHVRNLDTRVIKAERRSREEVLLYGEHLLELRIAVGNNDTAFSKELSSLGLHADKNVRSDAQKLAHAVASDAISRDDALLLPAREIRALPSPLKRRVSHGEKPKPEAPTEPDLFDTSAPSVKADDTPPISGDTALSAMRRRTALKSACLSCIVKASLLLCLHQVRVLATTTGDIERGHMFKILTMSTAILGMVAINGTIVHAWTDAENAYCARDDKPGLVHVPVGRGSKGSLSCRCEYTDPEVMRQDIAESHRKAHEQEEERRRKGGKPDESDTRPSKKTPQ